MNIESIQSTILGAYTEDSSFLEKDILLFISNVLVHLLRRTPVSLLLSQCVFRHS